MKKDRLVRPNIVKLAAWIFIIFAFSLGFFLLFKEYSAYKHPEIVVKWKTGSELDIVGFNILKNSDRSSDYVQINPSLIPAALDPLGGYEYEYLDDDVKAGTQYYYQLEAISTDETVEIYGPIEADTEKLSVLGFAPAFMSFLIAFITIFTLLKNDNVQKMNTRTTIVEYH